MRNKKIHNALKMLSLFWYQLHHILTAYAYSQQWPTQCIGLLTALAYSLHRPTHRIGLLTAQAYSPHRPTHWRRSHRIGLLSWFGRPVFWRTSRLADQLTILHSKAYILYRLLRTG